MDVQVGSDGETSYPITLLMAFLWLAIFSTVLSAAVTRWGDLLDVPATAMGTYVIAVGAQIPDTVQAVAVARRGHGSMAVASAVGSQVSHAPSGRGVPRACPRARARAWASASLLSRAWRTGARGVGARHAQVINVLIGLGVPWTITTGVGLPIKIESVGDSASGSLLTLVWYVYGCLAVYLLVLLAPTVPSQSHFAHEEAPTPRLHSAPCSVRRPRECTACVLLQVPTWGGYGHAQLGRREGYLLFAAYAVTVGLYAHSTLF